MNARGAEKKSGTFATIIRTRDALENLAATFIAVARIWSNIIARGKSANHWLVRWWPLRDKTWSTAGLCARNISPETVLADLAVDFGILIQGRNAIDEMRNVLRAFDLETRADEAAVAERIEIIVGRLSTLVIHPAALVERTDTTAATTTNRANLLRTNVLELKRKWAYLLTLLLEFQVQLLTLLFKRRISPFDARWIS